MGRNTPNGRLTDSPPACLRRFVTLATQTRPRPFMTALRWSAGEPQEPIVCDAPVTPARMSMIPTELTDNTWIASTCSQTFICISNGPL